MGLKERLSSKFIPLGLSAAILVVMGVIMTLDTHKLLARQQDLPPVIEFTWTPAGPVDLKEMRGYLTIHDDYALDFSTYRMRLVELDKDLDMPIAGLIGKDYAQTISFGLIADDPRLRDKDKLTVEISIADDRGQKATLTRVIPLKR